MAQFSFGSGQVFGVRTDIANQSPVALGVLQDIQVDFQGDLKELYGFNQFPVAVARGKTKITGKAKFARMNGALFNSLYFGQTLSTGQTLTSLSEPGTVPAVTTFTVTAANGADFIADLGVVYAVTGLPLARVTGAPTAGGQYSVTTGGVYTFDTADASAAVLLNYTYSSATSGTLIAIENLPMGTVPNWAATFTSTFNGKAITLGLNACVSNKLALPTKQDDWTIAELDFMALANAAGSVGYLSLAE